MAFEAYDIDDNGKDIRLGLLGPASDIKEMGIFVQYQKRLKNLNAFFKAGESNNPKSIIKDLDKLMSAVKIPKSLSLSFSNLYALAKRAKNTIKIVQ